MLLPEYKSFTEKQQFYQYKRINKRSEFDRFYDELKSNQANLIFRGLNEAKYKNYTSGQRVWKTNTLYHHLNYIDFLHKILYNIRGNKILYEYYISLDVAPNDLLYWAFLQHYGAPTPMLDFTHDLDTGLFFAFDKMQLNSTRSHIGDYVSLYYIDRQECGDELVDIVEMLNDGARRANEMVGEFQKEAPDVNVDTELLERIDEFTKWRTSNGLSSIPIGFYQLSSKFRLPGGEALVWANLNLIAQKGCFVNYNINDIPLEEYMSNHAYFPKLHCIDITKALCAYIQDKVGKKKSDIYPQEEDIAKKSYTDFMKVLQ